MSWRRSKPTIYGFDTETDNNGIDEAWIVQWALVKSDGWKQHGWTLTQLAEAMVNQLEEHNKCNLWYVHNLTYDINFLREHLHLAEDAGLKVEMMIRMSSVIMCRITHPETGSVIEFRDSAKKIPGALSKIGKAIGLPKLYPPGGDRNFTPGWSKKLDYSDPETWRYVERDAEIVAVAMQQMHNQGSTHATASGDSFASLKKWIRRDKKIYGEDWMWEKLFPKLTTALDAELRKGYFGGINISNPHHRGYNSGEITHGDVHNMYGAVMADDPLPYGEPTYTTVKPSDGSLYIAKVLVKLQLKDDMIPWYSFKSPIDYQMEFLKAGEPVEQCIEWHELYFTNIDLENLAETYDIEYHPDYECEYWVFKSNCGIFKSYIDYWTERKNEAEKKYGKASIEYLDAKNHINMVYGRFALAHDQDVTSIVWDDDLGDWTFHRDQGINDDIDSYLPLAMFVTAHARRRLMHHARAVGSAVIHCDTDSVIHLGGDSDVVTYTDGDDVVRGTWGHEERPVAIYEGGFKRYIEILHEPVQSLKDIVVTCAGVPQKKDELTGVPVGMWIELLDNPHLICEKTELGDPHYRIKSEWLRKIYIDNGFDPDNVDTMKLIPRKVKGGVILEKRNHTLSDNLQFRIRRFN